MNSFLRTLYLFGVFQTFAFSPFAQLVIRSGAQWKPSGNVQIVINNMPAITLEDANSSFGEAHLFVRGSDALQVNGTQQWKIGKLTLDKTAGHMVLNTPIRIEELLQIQNGMIDLHQQSITLAPQARIEGETAGNRIIGPEGGYIEVTTPLAAPIQAHPGQLGAVITSTANLGLTTIRRYHTAPGMPMAAMANRFYVIMPANNQALNTTLELHYFEEELNGLTENGLAVYTRNNGDWRPAGTGVHDPANNLISISGLSSLHQYGFTAASILPLLWGKVQAQCNTNNITVKWETLQEQHTSYFIVERSIDGAHWSEAGRAPATGNTTGMTAYQLAVDKPAAETSTYYRIVANDVDDKQSYSSVTTLKACSLLPAAKLWPNPASTQVNITLPATGNGMASITILGPDGKVWRQLNKSVTTGINLLTINIQSLAAGTYYLKIASGSGSPVVLPFVKL